MTAVPAVPTAAKFREALAAGDLERAGRIAASLQRSELALALSSLTADQVRLAYTGLGDEQLAGLLRQLVPLDAAGILRRLTDVEAADVIDDLPPDEAADVIAAIKSVEPGRVESILVEMDRAGDVQDLLKFLPETAGGRMTSDFLTVRPKTTAEEAIQVVRDHTRARGTEFRSYIYVTDEA
jgi:Mg/Co/Ni transporter MgtE